MTESDEKQVTKTTKERRGDEFQDPDELFTRSAHIWHTHTHTVPCQPQCSVPAVHVLPMPLQHSVPTQHCANMQQSLLSGLPSFVGFLFPSVTLFPNQTVFILCHVLLLLQPRICSLRSQKFTMSYPCSEQFFHFLF